MGSWCAFGDADFVRDVDGRLSNTKSIDFGLIALLLQTALYILTNTKLKKILRILTK